MSELTEPVAALSIQGLAHRIGDTPVLADLDLEVHPGELVGVLGTSGCGKTTLLRAIAGLITPDSGRIDIAGHTVVDAGKEQVRSEDRRVGMVFQDYALFPHMDVESNIAFGLAEPDPQRVSQLISLMGITDLAHRLPRSLSGGQQQRVALARALAPSPELLLLDEPFANVDSERRGAVGDTLHRIARKTGTSTLLVTHDPTSALGLSDRLLVLVSTTAGALVAQEGKPQEIYQRPANREVAVLTGPAFFLRGTGQGQRVDTRLGRLDLMEPSTGSMEVVIRPEQLAFLPNQQGSSTVKAAAFEGARTRLVCDSPVGKIHAHSTADVVPARGTKGFLSVRGAVWGLR